MNLFQLFFCLSSFTEATVICFDQCHSRSVNRPTCHRHFSAGLHHHLHVCESPCRGVWWQMRGGPHRDHRDRADNLKSLSSGRLNLTRPLLHLPCTASTHSVGFFSHLSACLDTTIQHVHWLYASWDFNSVSANVEILREACSDDHHHYWLCLDWKKEQMDWKRRFGKVNILKFENSCRGNISVDEKPNDEGKRRVKDRGMWNSKCD